MFSWASQTFDKLSQAVAPPPAGGAGKFAYAVQQGDEAGAIGCLAEIDPITTIVNQSKGMYPIHLACQHSMIQLVKIIMSQPGASLDATDTAGNTMLHYAATSKEKDAVALCKLLVSEYRASAMTKNYAGQTPYDVSTVSAVRQYLLPIQLQAETQHAIDNGGVGLPPGIDMGGLKIQNSAVPPPPSQFGSGPPSASAPAPPPPMAFGQPPTASAPVSAAAPPTGFPNAFGTPTPTNAQNNPSNSSLGVAPAPASMPVHLAAPSSGNREYARSGSSSAAIFSKPKEAGRTFVRPDGFHSSSSDVNLQKKYGHSSVGYSGAVPPPPTSGGNPIATPAPPSGGINPYAGSLPAANRRYVAYGPTAAPAPSPHVQYNFHSPSPVAPGVTMFMPGVSSGQQQTPAAYSPQPNAHPQERLQTQSSPQVLQPNASPHGSAHSNHQVAPHVPTTPIMPSPPYQTMQNQSQQQHAFSTASPTPSASAYGGAYTPSPAGATYGSAMTPGTTLETPGPFASNASIPVEVSGAGANEIFSSPPMSSSQSPSLGVVDNTPQANIGISSTPAVVGAQVGPDASKPSSTEALFGLSPPPTTTSASTPTSSHVTSPTAFEVPPPASSAPPYSTELSVTPVTLPQPAAVVRTKSAEEMFNEGPPLQAQQQDRHHTVAPTEAVSPASLARGKSAEEMFDQGPPPEQQASLPTVQHEYQHGVTTSDTLTSPNLAQVESAKEMFSEVPMSQSLDHIQHAPTPTVPPAGLERVKSAEELFDEGPPTQSAQQPSREQTLQAPKVDERLAEPAGLGITERARTMSADELFAGDAPESDQAGAALHAPVSQPYISSAHSAAESFSEVKLENVPQPVAPPANSSTPGGNGGASDYVGGVPSHSVGGGGSAAGSATAEQVFGAAPSQSVEIHDDENEEEMTDIPLSPEPVDRKLMPVPDNTTQQVTNTSAPAASSAESLFAAIGLPPPPVSSRR